MSKRENLILVADIFESLQRIQEYTKGLDYDGFCNNRMVIDAVIRNFEIAGEAASKTTLEFRSNNNQVDWRGLIDFRNRLIHHYFGVNTDIVWEVIEKEVPEYIDFLETIDGFNPKSI